MFPRVKEIQWEDEEVYVGPSTRLKIEISSYGNHAFYREGPRAGVRARLAYLHISSSIHAGEQLATFFLE